MRPKELHFERDVDCRGYWLIMDDNTALFIPQELMDSLKVSVDKIIEYVKEHPYRQP